MEGAPLSVAGIRRLEPRDVENVLALQRACPEAGQWTAQDYEIATTEPMMAWVAEDESGIAGFLVARRLVEEIEVLNLAVRPDARQHGTGTRLLRAAVDWGKSLGAEKVILEVRATNTCAREFYDRRGFLTVGRRPGYYSEPVDDALLLSLSIGGLKSSASETRLSQPGSAKPQSDRY